MTTDIRTIASPHDQRVTFVELFFDLVFVFCVTQVAALLHGHVAVLAAMLVTVCVIEHWQAAQPSIQEGES